MNITYIDDRPDSVISKTLQDFTKKNSEYTYKEVKFDSNCDYEKLLNNEIVCFSDIIIIDSYLFQNNTAFENKFFGEDFIILLKKAFPFKEVILISQNNIDSAALSIEKHKSSMTEKARDYYTRVLIEAIRDMSRIIKKTQYFLDRFKQNEDIDENIKCQILENASGSSKYEMLKKEDIDYFIKEFKRLSEA